MVMAWVWVFSGHCRLLVVLWSRECCQAAPKHCCFCALLQALWCLVSPSRPVWGLMEHTTGARTGQRLQHLWSLRH